MKSLYEIRDELASVYSVEKYPVTRMATIGMDGFTQDVNFARRMAADQFFKDGFDHGVKAAQDRAQVLVDAITDCLISEWLDKPESLKEALESYKKSMETK